MRIAQVAPLWEQLPPASHRSAEYSISLLTDELVRRGHDVTLFAAAGSDSLAWLEPGCDQPLAEAKVRLQEYLLHEQIQLSRVFNCPGRFDLIHVQGSMAALPYAQLSKTPVLHTLYELPSRLETEFCLQHRRQLLVYAGCSPWPDEMHEQLTPVAVLPPVIAPEQFRFYGAPQQPGYLAYLGDLSESSGIQRAIAVAQRSEIPLHIAALAETEGGMTHSSFFAREIAPQIDGQRIKYLGQLSSSYYNSFLGQAVATLCLGSEQAVPPWEAIESLASGTPLLAMGDEAPAIEQGCNGWVCQTVEDCVLALEKIAALSRTACRQSALSQFGIQALSERYEAIYRQLLGGRFSRLNSARALVPVAS